MGKGSTTGSSSQTNNIPPELSGLTTRSANTIGALQDQIPLSGFTGANPTGVAGLSGTQQKSLGLLNRNLDDSLKPLDQSEIVQAGNRYVDTSILPGVTNEATLSGLGRSTANTNARAAAEAQTMLPLLQGEQQRRDQLIGQGFSGGDVERSITQQGFNSQAQDSLRRQALAEQALFSTMPTLPSTLGQTGYTKSSGPGGGMFKILLPWVLIFGAIW